MGKPECKLSGLDGNVFGLISAAKSALVSAGMRDEAKQMVSEVMESGSYHEAIQTIMKYCDVC